MGEGSPKPASAPTGTVFLSYASEDVAAAERIAGALRAAGIEVWFDKSELRGGDVWDQKIRREIHDCALFIPVISANTASRQEGYFRLEWDLADQRTHRMARDRAFIVPVCLDATPGAGTDVPESSHRVQWTRFMSALGVFRALLTFGQHSHVVNMQQCFKTNLPKGSVVFLIYRIERMRVSQ
jgi:hypothetical protein